MAYGPLPWYDDLLAQAMTSHTRAQEEAEKRLAEARRERRPVEEAGALPALSYARRP